MMNTRKWIENNTRDLEGKTVVVSGSTGGIGQELCDHLASVGASLVLLDRNPARSAENRERILRNHPGIKVDLITADLEDMDSVKAAVEMLREIKPYALIHNAGAYSIPRHKCSTGYDNVFQINFLSPYYITKQLLPILRETVAESLPWAASPTIIQRLIPRIRISPPAVKQALSTAMQSGISCLHFTSFSVTRLVPTLR